MIFTATGQVKMWRGNMWVCLSVLHFWTFASRLVPLKAVYCTRPYHLEYYSSSRPISEGWDLFVLGWVNAWEYRLLWHFAQFCLFWHPCQVGDSTLLYPVSLLSGCWDDLYRNPNINTTWATNYPPPYSRLSLQAPACCRVKFPISKICFFLWGIWGCFILQQNPNPF